MQRVSGPVPHARIPTSVGVFECGFDSDEMYERPRAPDFSFSRIVQDPGRSSRIPGRNRKSTQSARMQRVSGPMPHAQILTSVGVFECGFDSDEM